MFAQKFDLTRYYFFDWTEFVLVGFLLGVSMKNLSHIRPFNLHPER